SVYVRETRTRARVADAREAWPGAKAKAGGSVLVAADDDAGFVMVAGNLGIGKKFGVGAAGTVLVQDDTVEAYIGKNAEVDALGAGGSLLAFTGAKDSDGNMLTQAFNGLAVTATSHEDILTIAAGA